MAALVPADRYTKVAIALHWGIAAIILFNLFLGIGHDALPREWKVMPVHKALGIAVLALSVARLAWRLTHRPPPFADGVTRLERAGATAVHALLYALMIVVPLTGWLMVSGAETRRPLTFFWLFDIPYLPVGRAAGAFGHDAHELLGYLMLGLVVLHVAAALWHHLVRRDATLTHMVPLLRRRV